MGDNAILIYYNNKYIYYLNIILENRGLFESKRLRATDLGQVRPANRQNRGHVCG